MAKFRIPLICTIAALALSFLLGLISGVRFSTILLRSLIISLISGGFVLGAQILLDHFIDDEEYDPESDMIEAEPVDEDSISDDATELSDADLIDEDFENIKDDSQASASKNGVSSGTEKKQEKNTVKELEELPDLQDFIPEDEPEQDDQMDFTQRGTSAFDVSTDLAGSGMDTNTMVNAIRTVLKRDS